MRASRRPLNLILCSRQCNLLPSAPGVFVSPKGFGWGACRLISSHASLEEEKEKSKAAAGSSETSAGEVESHPTSEVPQPELDKRVVSLCRHGRIGEAAALYARGRATSAFSASALITAFGKHRNIKRAMGVYKDFIASGHQPDSIMIGSLASACRRSGEPEKALQLLDDIDCFDIALDELGFRLLAAAAAEAGDAVAAKRLLAKLREGSLPFKATVVSWGQLLRGLVAKSTASEVSARIADVLSLLDLMEEQDVAQQSPHSSPPPPPPAACVATGEVDLRQQLRSRILGSRHPGVKGGYVVTSLVGMYSRCGLVDDAVGLFSDLRRQQRQQVENGTPFPALDVYCWAATIQALGQAGRGKEALDLFREMIEEGEPAPGPMALTAVLNACSRTGLVDEALGIYDALNAGHYEPVAADIHHRNCVVDALCRAGRLHEAERFIETNIPHPNEVTWRTLLTACHTQGDVALAERAAKSRDKLRR